MNPTVPLNHPFRTPNGPKQFAVYVQNANGKVFKLPFGHGVASNLEAPAWKAEHWVGRKVVLTAATWQDFVRGEWWILDGFSHFADNQIGDQGHEGIAEQALLAIHEDAIREALEAKGLPAEWRESDELHSLYHEGKIPTEVLEEVMGKDKYDLFRKDVRLAYSRETGAVLAINLNFAADVVTPKSIRWIKDHLDEQMQGEEVDLEGAEVLVEEYSTGRHVSMPLADFLAVKNPGELWRFSGRVAAAVGRSFLPTRLVEVDCEMTGVRPDRDKLLQIAMLKLELKGNQYQETGEPLVLYLKHDGQPQNDFHRQYLTHIFKKCNESDLAPEQAKQQIHTWLGDWKGTVTPTGDCVHTDLAFLVASGCIDQGDIGDDGPIPGTFHYEAFDANPVKALARQKSGRKEDKKELAGFDEEGIHDALVDCRNQLKELNHYLGVLLGSEVQASMPIEKKLDVTQLFNDIRAFYTNNPGRREEINSVFIDLAHKMGIKIPFIDNRDFFLIADEKGQFVRSVSGFREAAKIVEQNPGYKYYNRTHPRCPKELREQFDLLTGWTVQADTKEEIQEQYAQKTSFLHYPVTVAGDPGHHITVKFLGEDPVTVEQVQQALEGLDLSPPAPDEWEWEAVEFDTKKNGKVRVLELVRFPERLQAAHDALGGLRPDDYPSYRPHITVSDALWEKVREELLEPQDLELQVHPLVLEVKGERVATFASIEAAHRVAKPEYGFTKP